MPAQPDWTKVRDEFPTLKDTNYLNSCSLGLLSNRTREALYQFIDLWTRYGAKSWYIYWLGEIGEVRREFAALINASPEEIAVLPNISSTLAAISSSLDLSEGDQVVTCALDFPTIPHHFLAKTRNGVETVVIPSSDGVKVDLDQFEGAITERTALVATTRVYFTSGYIQDVASLAELAHRRGALLFMDDYQAAGQVPIDVKATDVDVLVSGGLKWLLGGPGIAYMYVKGDLLEGLTPTIAGWFGNRNQFDFNPREMAFREDAAKFETGTPSVAAVYAGAAGLRQVNELGPEAIRERTSGLTIHLVEGLASEGFKLRIPKESERHASITMVELENPEGMVQELAKRSIIVDSRPGAVRVSPYFYNTVEDIDQAVSAMVEIRSSLSR